MRKRIVVHFVDPKESIQHVLESPFFNECRFAYFLLNCLRDWTPLRDPGKFRTLLADTEGERAVIHELALSRPEIVYELNNCDASRYIVVYPSPKNPQLLKLKYYLPYRDSREFRIIPNWHGAAYRFINTYGAEDDPRLPIMLEDSGTLGLGMVPDTQLRLRHRLLKAIDRGETHEVLHALKKRLASVPRDLASAVHLQKQFEKTLDHSMLERQRKLLPHLWERLEQDEKHALSIDRRNRIYR